MAMEPTETVVHIDNEIKFKKADVNALNGSEDFLENQSFRVCSISNVKYDVTVSKYSKKLYISMYASAGNATNINIKIDYCVISANYYKKIYLEHTSDENNRILSIPVTKFVCGITDNIYDDGKIIVKIKGSFKITLPSKTRYPISAIWRIKETDLEALRTSTNGFINSKRFSVSTDSDIKYFFTIYPNGNRDELRGQTRLSLDFGGNPFANEAVFNVEIDSANYSQASKYIEFRNYFDICSTEELFNPAARFIVDGELIIKVTGIILIEKENVEATMLSCKDGIATKRFQKHRGKDFKMVIGEKSIKVHKKILIEASPVFTAMFKSNMKEVLEKKMDITDFDYDVVDAAIKLLYSSSVPQKFTLEQMLSLLQFSDKYDIQLIKDLVQNYFIEKISPTNVCQLINFTTSTVDATVLQKRCSEYLVKCMEEKKAVHGLETLDRDFVFKMFSGAFAQSL